MSVILDPSAGYALPEKAVRVAEIIHDFDPDLEVKWIPPRARHDFDTKPFAIWHHSQKHPDGGYFIMWLAEDEMDHRVLAKLFQGRNTTLSDIDAHNKAMEVMRFKQRMEEIEDQREFEKFVIKSNKTVRHNGVKYE